MDLDLIYGLRFMVAYVQDFYYSSFTVFMMIIMYGLNSKVLTISVIAPLVLPGLGLGATICHRLGFVLFRLLFTISGVSGCRVRVSGASGFRGDRADHLARVEDH